MELKFNLTENEAQIILDALVKQPYVSVVDVINKIQSQASEQMKQEES